jgi:RNA polymerase sigma-70 factor (ECF subfamily)
VLINLLPPYINNNQETLISGLSAGDNAAFYELVKIHQGWMKQLAKKILIDSHLAEDCVQESFINVAQKIHLFEQRSSLKTWLRKIVVNNCLMKLRQNKNRNEHNIDDLMPEFDRNDCRLEPQWEHLKTPDELMSRQENIKTILDFIHMLPEDYKVTIILRDIEELTTREVSELLECSEGTVKVRLHRARCALKKLLEPMMRDEDEL